MIVSNDAPWRVPVLTVELLVYGVDGSLGLLPNLLEYRLSGGGNGNLVGIELDW